MQLTSDYQLHKFLNLCHSLFVNKDTNTTYVRRLSKQLNGSVHIILSICPAQSKCSVKIYCIHLLYHEGLCFSKNSLQLILVQDNNGFGLLQDFKQINHESYLNVYLFLMKSKNQMVTVITSLPHNHAVVEIYL